MLVCRLCKKHNLISYHKYWLGWTVIYVYFPGSVLSLQVPFHCADFDLWCVRQTNYWFTIASRWNTHHLPGSVCCSHYHQIHLEETGTWKLESSFRCSGGNMSPCYAVLLLLLLLLIRGSVILIHIIPSKINIHVFNFMHFKSILKFVEHFRRDFSSFRLCFSISSCEMMDVGCGCETNARSRLARPIFKGEQDVWPIN